jgi:WhiB family transcriptional regulator, redox-sensing transcriptional regulator
MTTSPRPLSAETVTIPDRDWRLLAACRHADPELFFPVSPSGPSLDQVTQAKAICAGCPVRQQCLAFALDTRQDHGVWGGMSEEERRPQAGPGNNVTVR